MTSRLMLLLGAMSESTVLSRLGSVLISEGHVAIKDHVDVSDLGCYLREAMLTSEHCAELAPPLSWAVLGELALEAWLRKVWFYHLSAVK